MEASNLHPPMSLRVNLKKTTRADYLALLGKASIGASPIVHTEAGVVLDQPMPAEALPNFREGHVSVQDGGAQLAAGLMDLQAAIDSPEATALKRHMSSLNPADVKGFMEDLGVLSLLEAAVLGGP